MTSGASPVAGVTVTFAITAGGGALSSVSTDTDASGFARTTLTLGPIAGPNTVAATASGAPGSITFTATGIAFATSNGWTQRTLNGSTSAPPAGGGLTAAWDGQGMVVAGADARPVWSYDPGTNGWRVVSASRWASSVLVDTHRGPLSLGGFPGPVDGLAAFDRTRGDWEVILSPGDPLSPPERSFTAAASDRSRVVLFGGSRSAGLLGDTWIFDVGAARWSLALPSGAPGTPTARSGHGMAWDGSRALLFGGEDASGLRNDLWAYDPASNGWTLLIPDGRASSPPARRRACLAWNGHELFLFGGSGVAAVLGDLWRWDPAGNAWSRIHDTGAPNAPPARRAACMAWDGAQLILFGGFSGFTLDTLNDTWTYVPGPTAPPPLIARVSPEQAPVGAPVPVTIEGAHFEQGAAVSLGATLVPSARVDASTRISCTLPDDVAGVHTITVTNPSGSSASVAAFRRTQGTSSASALAFDVSPASAWEGARLRPIVEVSIRDATGAIAPVATTVTVSLATSPGGATLVGTTSRTTVNGVARFDDLAVDARGTGYVLVASSPGLPDATSAPFDVTGPPGAVFAITQSPGDGIATDDLSPVLEVEIRDSVGNLCTYTTAALTASLGPTGQLFGTPTRQASGGVVRFPGLGVHVARRDHELSVRTAAGRFAASVRFAIFPGAPHHAFVPDVRDVVAGALFQVRTALYDAWGNVAWTTTQSVTLSFTPGASGGATLLGTTSAVTSDGAAVFPDVSIERAGAYLRLRVDSPGLAFPSDSVPFSVLPAPARSLSFMTLPSRGFRRVFLEGPGRVEALDAYGNRVTSAAGSVRLALAPNAAGAVLRGAVDADLVDGVATFPQVSVDRVGGSLALVATTPGVAPATSGTFDVTELVPEVTSVTLPPGLLSGTVLVTYGLRADAPVRADVSVELGVSPAGPFRRATPAGTTGGSEGTYGLATSPGGQAHVFAWDSAADFPGATPGAFTIRVTPSFRGVVGASQEASGIASNPPGPTRPELAAPRLVHAVIPGAAVHVTLGELTGDGALDAVTGSSASSTFRGWRVVMGDGAGALSGEILLTGSGVASCAGDLDGDGCVDLAAPEGNAIRVFHGPIDPRSPRWITPIATSETVTALTIADVDSDQLGDLVVATSDGTATVNSLCIYRGIGGRRFALLQTIGLPAEASSVRAADVSGDGHLDLVTLSRATVVLALGSGDGTFAAPFVLTAGPIVGVEPGDLDRDGRSDLAVVSLASGPGPEVHAFLSQGGGAFRTVTSPLEGSPATFGLGDVDGDGRADLVVFSPAQDDASGVYPGNGDGTFGARVSLPSSGAPASCAVGDLSGTGRAGVVLADVRDSTVLVYRNRGAGFDADARHAVGAGPTQLAAADLNADGTLDAVTSNVGSGTISVLLGRPAGGFSAATDFAAGTRPTSLVLADLDSSGQPDVAVVEERGSRLTILAGTGAGTFGPPLATSVGSSLVMVRAADLTGDGRVDLVLADSASGVSVLRGRGNLTFDAPVPASSLVPVGLALADVEGDGDVDLVLATATSVSVLRNDGAGRLVADAPAPLPGAYPGGPVGVHDVDGDGRRELLVGSDNAVLVLAATGSGPFTFVRYLDGLGGAVRSFDLADVNGDGISDLVASVALATRDAVVVRRAFARGLFDHGIAGSFHVLPGSVSSVIRDLDGDGKCDVLVVGTTDPAGPSPTSPDGFVQLLRAR